MKSRSVFPQKVTITVKLVCIVTQTSTRLWSTTFLDCLLDIVQKWKSGTFWHEHRCMWAEGKWMNASMYFSIPRTVSWLVRSIYRSWHFAYYLSPDSLLNKPDTFVNNPDSFLTNGTPWLTIQALFLTNGTSRLTIQTLFLTNGTPWLTIQTHFLTKCTLGCQSRLTS